MQKVQGRYGIVGKRERMAAWQIHILVGAENAARFCVLLPILTERTWTGRGLGIFTAFCLAGCLIGGLLERLLWNEEQLFAVILHMGGRKAAMTVYFGLFWFFLAQAPVMLRLAGEVMVYCFRERTRLGLLFFFPFLISSACNSIIYVRKIFVRLYTEGPKGWNALGKDWFFRSREPVWWGLVFAVVVLALAFTDQFALAGFYCAYNWQVMAAAATATAVAMAAAQKRRKKGL